MLYFSSCVTLATMTGHVWFYAPNNEGKGKTIFENACVAAKSFICLRVQVLIPVLGGSPPCRLLLFGIFIT